jgi:hypothetical protein
MGIFRLDVPQQAGITGINKKTAGVEACRFLFSNHTAAMESRPTTCLEAHDFYTLTLRRLWKANLSLKAGFGMHAGEVNLLQQVSH